LPPEYSTDVRWRLNRKKRFVCCNFIQRNLRKLFSENSEESSKRIFQPRIRSESGMKNLWTQVASVGEEFRPTEYECGNNRVQKAYQRSDMVTTFWNRQLPERWIGQGGSTSWPPRSPDYTPSHFSCGLRSANAYKPEQLEGSKTNSDFKNQSAFTAKCLARSRLSSWCVQGNKWSTYFTCIGNEKNFLSCSLQRCAFNFCVAITFLPIN
jgi:hypothetical protein